MINFGRSKNSPVSISFLYLVTVIAYTALGMSVTNELPYLISEVQLNPVVSGYWIAAASGGSALTVLVFGKLFPRGVSFKGWATLLLSQGLIALVLANIGSTPRLFAWFLFVTLIPVSQSAAVSAISAAGIPDIVHVRAKIRVLVNISMALGALSWTFFQTNGFNSASMYAMSGIIFISAALFCFFSLGLSTSANQRSSEAARTASGRISKKALFYVLSFFPVYCCGTILSFGVPFLVEDSDIVMLDKIGFFFSINMLLVVVLQVPISKLVERNSSSRYIPITVLVLLGATLTSVYLFGALSAGTVGMAICVILISLVEIVGSNFDFSIFYKIVNKENLGAVSSLRSSVETSAQVVVPLAFPLLVFLPVQSFILFFTIFLFAWGIIFVSDRGIWSVSPES